MVFGLTSDEIKVKVETEKDCVQKISVEMPVSKVKQEIDRAFENVRGRAKAPGFRAGKMPLDLIRENYRDSAYAQAQDELLQQGVLEALKSKKITPIQSPSVQSLDFSPDKPFHFEFRVEVAPQFKISGYKGLKLNKKKKSITDEDVLKTIQNIANSNAQLVEAPDSELKSQHFAVVDYEGFLEGKPIENSTATNFLIDLSAPQAISGLAEGLNGMKIGEDRQVPVKFPADSPAKDLAGKEALFRVKLNAIKEKKVPALDDEFAKDLGLESFEQMKLRVRENLEKEAEQGVQKDLEKQITNHLLEENTFAVPPSLIERQLGYLTSRQRDFLARQGFSKEEQDRNIESLKPEMRIQAEKDVRLAYVLNAIAEAEKIEVTEEEIMTKINAVIESASEKERPALEKVLKESYRDQIRSEIRDARLFSWVLSNAKVKDISGGS